ncbi:redoxin domain-containing protein [Patescibacteria group bacterium]|nr:redoxin domain-containing protein [Patescibacteria group bacterium]
MFLHRLGKIRAPEFPLGLNWLNTKPLTMKSLLGKPVLIDFWTYSCINCIRTLPHLKEWHEKYADKGLTIIGVHTPEFEFEKKQENVERALKNHNVSYPVVLDSEYKIWNLYANRWWPRKFLIDHKGLIVYDHIGEGGYAETEVAIQKTLDAIGVKGLAPVKPDVSVAGGVCYRTTPETYLGFLRGRYGNIKDFIPNTEQVFTDQDNERERDLVYLHGHWKLTAESVSHTRKVPGATEYLALKYSAFSVYLVMGTTDGKSARVEVELDGRPLPDDMAGEDVKIDQGGRSVVTIKEPRMYRLVSSDTYHHGTLKLKTGANNIAMFAFTFGGCKGM